MVQTRPEKPIQLSSFSSAWPYIRGWAQPAVLATVGVAVLAFFIQQQLADQENQIQAEIAKQERIRASVARSVALYQDFVESEAVRELRKIHYEIEHLVWKEETGNEKDRGIIVFAKSSFGEEANEIRLALLGMLQRLTLIYKCGEFEEIYENPGNQEPEPPEDHVDEPLCDRNTISVLIGPILAEFFYTFRPLAYCDDFIRHNYFPKEKLSSYVGRWESLVEDHVKRDKRGVILKVFRNEDEKNDAIKKGDWHEDNENYSVLRLTDKRCKLFHGQENT